MKSKIAISIIASLLSFSIISPDAYAAKSIKDLKKEMEERQSERKKAEAAINEKKNERDEKIKERNTLDVRIAALMGDIESTESVILEKDAAISEKEAQIDEMNVIINTNTDILKKRMKVMYEYGTSSYLELILEAKGLGDFFSRVSVIKDIIEHDKTLINTYVSARTEIENAKQVIENEKGEQLEAKSILEGKKSELQSLQDKQNEVIQELNADIKLLEKQEQKAEDDYNSLKKELEKALSSDSTTPAYKGNGKFTWPSAASTRVTSEFGHRNKPNAKATSNHRGIDIGAPSGTNVLAAEAGVVTTAGYNGSYGYYVTINHGSGYVTLYAHNSRLVVSKGDKVTKGQVIAKVGSTGNSTGPHIHFEVMVNGVCKNPRNYF